jgi:ubiquinone/menaquinone biosynthesis C-methylase UbiE
LENVILDVGCGWNRKFGHRKTPNSIGLDLKRGVCDIVADALHLPVRDAVINKVYASHVIEHLSALDLAKSVQRVLKKDGFFIVETPHALDILKIFRVLRRGYYTGKEREHIQTFGEMELRNLFELAGFKVKEVSFTKTSRLRGKSKHDWIRKFFPRFSSDIRVIGVKD